MAARTAKEGNIMRIQMLACASMLALMLVAPAAAQTAPAAGTTTRTIDNPQVTGTVTTTRDPAAGSFSRDATLTRRSDGATATSSIDRTRADGTTTTTASRTGFNGQTSSSNITRTRTETGFTEAGTITGPQGNMLNLNGSVTRANGTLTANRALTNAAGETVASRNLTATRAANGQVTRNLTTTGPQRLLNRAGRPAGARPGPRG